MGLLCIWVHTIVFYFRWLSEGQPLFVLIVNVWLNSWVQQQAKSRKEGVFYLNVKNIEKFLLVSV